MQIEPTKDQFLASGAAHRLVPLTTTLLADEETPLSLYRRLAQGRPGAFLLESATTGAWDRYSFVGCDPIATLTEHEGRGRWLGEPPAGVLADGDPLDMIRSTLGVLHSERSLVDLPAMISSLVGYLGWDTVRRIERLGEGPAEVAPLPELSLSIPGDVAIFDHVTSRVTLVANVFNVDGEPTGIEEAYARGVERLEAMVARLAEPRSSEVRTLTLREPHAVSLTPKDEYLASIREAQERIVDGDIFQVVIGQRFEQECSADPLEVYRVLRATNPSPYMYVMDVPDPVTGEYGFTIVGSSPESLVKVESGRVTTHPIAGSRPRGSDTAADAALAEELLADPKERAEHLMLVDLARNDLAKVCAPGSVDVVEFMQIVRYSHIMHIVSTVTGLLEDGRTGLDAVTATFPAGTLSGAPKPMALRIIDELEPVARGIYGGVVGYLSFSGDVDVAIAIRTGIVRDGSVSVYAGGGIVADSTPEGEYRESCTKAAAVLAAAASTKDFVPVAGAAGDSDRGLGR